jgi:hypothetical protein
LFSEHRHRVAICTFWLSPMPVLPSRIVFVVPLVYLAAITFPFLFTVICTTTVPNSLHFCTSFPLELMLRPFNPHPLPFPVPFRIHNNCSHRSPFKLPLSPAILSFLLLLLPFHLILVRSRCLTVHQRCF